MTLKEAIKSLVHDGDTIAFGGLMTREPVAAVYEIIRQNIQDLTIISDTRTETGEFLIGAGLVRKIESAYIWVGVVGKGVNFKRAAEEGIPRRVEIEEYSNFSAGMRFLAGALGVPFMPVKSLLGSDLPQYNPQIKIMADPYDGEEVALVPAAKPEVAIVHVQRADKLGNAQIWGMASNDANIVRAAKRTIVTCEEIIPTSEIRIIPEMTLIPCYCVDAVVEVPYGAHPASTPWYYDMDVLFRREWLLQAEKGNGYFQGWLDEWVRGCVDNEEYLRKVGFDRLAMLQKIEHDNYKIPKVDADLKGVE
jgi:glutaconate CoA-transferase subunit A